MEMIVVASAAVIGPLLGFTTWYGLIRPYARKRYERAHHRNKSRSAKR